MKKLILFVLVAEVSFLPAVISADDGEAVFKSNKCGACHKAETSSAGRPSLKEISQAYQGKEKQLKAYFSGEADPIVTPAKASIMKRYIEKTKALSDADRTVLVEYIMRH